MNILNKIIECKNKFSNAGERTFEAIQYNGNNYAEIKKFVNKYQNHVIRAIKPEIFILSLENNDQENNIKVNDWILRIKRNDNHIPLYSSVSNEIMNSNFMMLN